MVRKGECNHCGWCCQFNGVHRNVVEATGADERFYQLRRAKRTPDGQHLLYLAHEYLPCSAHDVVQRRCTVYADRPQTCRDFPEVPEQVEGTPCSHWFERELPEGRIERRGGDVSPYPSPPRFFAPQK